MSSINSGDKFLVNRSNTSYQLEAVNTMAEIQDNDLMLINRGGTSYKITGADVKESLDPLEPPVLQSLTISQNPDGTNRRFTGQTFTCKAIYANIGNPPPTLSIRVSLIAQIYNETDPEPVQQLLYCSLNGGLNILDFQESDPGFTNVNGSLQNVVTFPLVMPDARTPDQTLLNGTSIFFEFKAINDSTVTGTSNILTPDPTSCTPGVLQTGEITGVAALDGDWTNSTSLRHYQTCGTAGVNIQGDWIYLSACDDESGGYARNQTWIKYILNRVDQEAANPGSPLNSMQSINCASQGGSFYDIGPNKAWKTMSYGEVIVDEETGATEPRFIAIAGDEWSGPYAAYAKIGISDWMNDRFFQGRNTRPYTVTSGTIEPLVNKVLNEIDYTDSCYDPLNKQFVAVGTTGNSFQYKLINSLDGENWGIPGDEISAAQANSPSAPFGKTVATDGNGTFLVGSFVSSNSANRLHICTDIFDHDSWYHYDMPFRVDKIRYGNGVWVIHSDFSYYANNTNDFSPENWIYWNTTNQLAGEPSSITGKNFQTLAFAGGYFFIGRTDWDPIQVSGYYYALAKSTDGINWSMPKIMRVKATGEVEPMNNYFNVIDMFYHDGYWANLPSSHADSAYISQTGGGDETQLFLSNTQDLADFKNSMPINQSDSAASGLATRSDLTDRTMNVINTTGTWSANTGKTVIGENKVCPEIQLFDSNPADVATFNAARDSLDNYEEQRDTTRADIKSRMLQANFSDDEVSALGLDD